MAAKVVATRTHYNYTTNAPYEDNSLLQTTQTTGGSSSSRGSPTAHASDAMALETGALEAPPRRDWRSEARAIVRTASSTGEARVTSIVTPNLG